MNRIFRPTLILIFGFSSISWAQEQDPQALTKLVTQLQDKVATKEDDFGQLTGNAGGGIACGMIPSE